MCKATFAFVLKPYFVGQGLEAHCAGAHCVVVGQSPEAHRVVAHCAWMAGQGVRCRDHHGDQSGVLDVVRCEDHCGDRDRYGDQDHYGDRDRYGDHHEDRDRRGVPLVRYCQDGVRVEGLLPEEVHLAVNWGDPVAAIKNN